MTIDKSWTQIRKRSNSTVFWQGLQSFLQMDKPHVNDRGFIRCPCNRCINNAQHQLEVLETHIHRFGFMSDYNEWIYHGENVYAASSSNVLHPNSGVHDRDEMFEVLEDIISNDAEVDQLGSQSSNVQYDDLFTALNSELYPGVSSFSSLNFLVKLMHLKVMNKWTNKSFDELLKLLKLAFPKMDLVESYYEAKKLMTKMGLGYQSIHVCKNDCALFWNENSMSETCPVCFESRWKMQAGRRTGKNVPHKVLRYFPLAPRLKRLFATSKTAKLMRWHQAGKSTDDNVMRHPVDGRAWKDFDSKHTEFADDVRNVRLGLAADGFNPFNNMSISYSMWPVVLTTYNLPPWLCMKPEYLMLSLLIPGPQSPGKDMDVFLRPLIEELKELWENGIDTRNAGNDRKVFKMRAALLWTVNDFPARSSLSGWSGQGYKACPTCNENTPSMRVIGKTAYFGHRRFLPSTHRWRSNLDFDGRTDRKRPPRKFSSVDIMDQLRRVKTTIPGKHPNYRGVKRKRGDDELNWRKKSIFYELPYWAEIELKHNLDVMHIEKNICDSLLGTLMGDPHKSKDTDNTRRDLQNLGIRSELHLYEDGNKLMKPAAEYTFSEANRRKFCRFIRSVKFPDGFAANLWKNVAQNDSRIVGLKSHDCHVIMQRLLPVGCRSLVNKTISSTIIELCTFFNQLCERTVNVTDMVKAQDQLVIILCKLERIFPPTFFDIMIHLVLHLPEEAILGGPVYMRWMYPFERNAAKPEGSISEGYVVDEALTFCSRYFDDIETRFNRPDRNDDGIHRTRRLFVFESQCKPMGKQSQVYVEKNVRDRAEFYILNNSPEIETYLNQHKQELQLRGCLNPDEAHRNEFADWFFEKIYAMNRVHAPEVTHELLSLASKSNIFVSSYPACIVNGVRFVTHAHDVRLKTQNSGVSVPGTENEIFYGQLQEILEFSYLNDFSVVLFKCKWFRCDSRRMITENNITSINITSESCKDDQFILASQAQQVFYVEDPSREDGINDIDLLQDNSSSNFTLFVDLGNLPQINLQRNDGDVIPIVQPFTAVSQHVNETVSFLNDDDEEDISEEDDETIEESVDEETDEGNDAVDTEEDDDDHSYHTSDSD
ncbi:hypothetical protein UlMin_023237 [Ulmus minor]